MCMHIQGDLICYGACVRACLRAIDGRGNEPRPCFIAWTLVVVRVHLSIYQEQQQQNVRASERARIQSSVVTQPVKRRPKEVCKLHDLFRSGALCSCLLAAAASGVGTLNSAWLIYSYYLASHTYIRTYVHACKWLTHDLTWCMHLRRYVHVLLATVV